MIFLREELNKDNLVYNSCSENYNNKSYPNYSQIKMLLKSNSLYTYCKVCNLPKDKLKKDKLISTICYKN